MPLVSHDAYDRSSVCALAEASEMPDKELQHLFAEASALAAEKQKIAEGNSLMVQWLSFSR
jgi:hypothetical protein